MKPGRRRRLFLDIEGHRSGDGGFDADMLELQHDFLLPVLGPFLCEIHCPLEFLEKLAALIARPRINLLLYHGLFAVVPERSAAEVSS